MLKELSKLFTYMVRLADMGCVALAFFLTYDLRNTFKTLYPLHTYLWVLPVLLAKNRPMRDISVLRMGYRLS